MNKNITTYGRIPDWPHLRKKYADFWQRRRGPDSVIAQIQNPSARRPAPESWMLEATESKYLDPARLFALQTWHMTAWQWHADLFHYHRPFYGPNMFAAFAGAKPVFGADTVWYEPMLHDLDEADRIRFDENSPYWKNHLETVDYFSQACAGIAPVAVTDLGGIADLICCFLKVEEVMIAALEQPDRLRALALRLADEIVRAQSLIHRRIAARQDGVANWMPVWHDGTLGTVADDMAVGLSPRLYADVFLPALRRMAAASERTILHWHDACRHHLTALLAVPEISAIQFGHDPNSPPFRELLPDMQNIQAAGKALFISCVAAEDAEFFIRRLDPGGLLMIINTDSDEASRIMTDNVQHWCAERVRELEG